MQGRATVSSPLSEHTHPHTYPAWTCSYRRASSGRWRATPGWPRTWTPRRRGRGCGTWPECLGVRSEGSTTSGPSTQLHSDGEDTTGNSEVPSKRPLASSSTGVDLTASAKELLTFGWLIPDILSDGNVLYLQPSKRRSNTTHLPQKCLFLGQP